MNTQICQLSSATMAEPVQRPISRLLTTRERRTACQDAAVVTTLLHLLRHADAGDATHWPGPDDLRPLSSEGLAQAERLAAHLASIGFECDAVLTSPRVRAVQTAEPVADALGLRVVVEPRLGEGLSVQRLDALLRRAGDPRAPILVGHDPDFSDLLTTLVGAVDISMKKGALARLEARRPFVAGGARLRWLLPPDVLRPR